MSNNTQNIQYFGIAFLAVVLISSINIIENLFNVIGYYAVVLWVSWQLTKLYKSYYNTDTIDPNGKAVLITGCDTGFGNSLAQQLDSKGFTVFASCYNPDSKGAQDLLKKCSKKLKLFKLDVTNDEDVIEAVIYVKKHLGNNSFWALVNNAGILNFVPIEWGKPGIELFKSHMDVNCFGQVRVTKAFLPLLRRTKDSRIVNVESLAGRLSLPGIGSYSMSKFAVRAFSDALRNEVKPFDINVIVIEPTCYSTGMTDQNKWTDDFITKWKEAPEDVRKDYGDEKCDVLHERINSILATTKDNSQEVIDAMIDATMNRFPNSYYYVYGLLESLTVPIFDVLPPELYDILVDEKLYFPLYKLNRNKNRL